ncbi:MAG: DNA replication and repair protein RecF [Muribaculaceae bacterium]|nr:DNA replication and repair protein RecF [Muribaculaceae bacterium]
MILNRLNILNYKNIAEASLEFSPKLNCLVGNNGMGKTNVLDAIHFLSFCKSYNAQPDSTVINHNADFALLQGNYSREDNTEDISISIQRGKRKIVRRGKKEYQRLSQHIGLLPLVMVSPMDWDLIRGAGEERRKLMDQIISQNNREYLNALIQYNKCIEQRNSLIRNGNTDPLLYESIEQNACSAATLIHGARQEWIQQFTPVFMQFYEAVAGAGETVALNYHSHLSQLPMKDVFDQRRQRDLAIGYTTGGVHRDDIDLLLNGYSMRKTGSQGQCKTYTIALRLAQFNFLKSTGTTTPILLLDDIFDRLDSQRVENIISLVSSNNFGQIFITDTNRSHIDEILKSSGSDSRMIGVENGICSYL